MGRHQLPCPVCGGLLHLTDAATSRPDCLLHHRETSDAHMYDVLRRSMLTDDARSFLGADASTGPCAGGGHLWVAMNGMSELEILSCLACATMAVGTEHPAV